MVDRGAEAPLSKYWVWCYLKSSCKVYRSCSTMRASSWAGFAELLAVKWRGYKCAPLQISLKIGLAKYRVG